MFYLSFSYTIFHMFLCYTFSMQGEPKIVEVEKIRQFPYEPQVLKIENVKDATYLGYRELDFVSDNLSLNTVYCEKVIYPTSVSFHYHLYVSIDGLTYRIYLNKTSSGRAGYGFETVLYGYALTKISEEGRDVLFKCIADFFETCYQHDHTILEINSFPSTVSYTRADMDECREAILAMNIGIDKEDLLNEYRGKDLFDLYKEKTGKSFFKDSGDETFRKNMDIAKWRQEYFMRKHGKYLKYWHTVSDAYGVGYGIRRNEEKGTE